MLNPFPVATCNKEGKDTPTHYSLLNLLLATCQERSYTFVASCEDDAFARGITVQSSSAQGNKLRQHLGRLKRTLQSSADELADAKHDTRLHRVVLT
jgi:hypothetical protein